MYITKPKGGDYMATTPTQIRIDALRQDRQLEAKYRNT